MDPLDAFMADVSKEVSQYPGGGGGGSPIKMTGVLIGNFEKNPQKVPESCNCNVCNAHLINFHP